MVKPEFLPFPTLPLDTLLASNVLSLLSFPTPSLPVFAPLRAGGDHKLENQLHQAGPCTPEGPPSPQCLLCSVPATSARELLLPRPR